MIYSSMIVEETITFTISRFNLRFYPNNRIGDIISFPVINLSLGCGIRIHVKCDFCDTEKKIEYRKYIKNTKNHTVEYSCSNKCSVAKYKKTCMDKYGVDNAYKLECNQLKVKETMMERYGFDNPNKVKIFTDKIVNTKIKNGLFSENRTDYQIYSNKCRSLTYLNKNILLKEFDGIDFYDGENIMEYFNLPPLHPNYPTVDHKISILEGFKNNISPGEIADINNLCITKRSINSSFGGRMDKKEKFF